MRKRTQARECALKILYQIEIHHEEAAEVLGRFWEHQSEDDDVRRYAEKIVTGMIERIGEIDQKIEAVAMNWKLKRMAILDRNILRLGAYEILFTDDIPPKVAINEAVNMAKKYSQADSGKFVNGILDKLAGGLLKSKSEQ